MAEFKKLTYVDGSLWFNGQLVATVSDEWIRGNIQTIKNILEVSSGGPGVAADVSYDNTISQILATNVQTAIDEIHEEIDDRAGACEGRLDVLEDNIEGLVDSINIEVIPEELGDTVGDAISSINDSLSRKVELKSATFSGTSATTNGLIATGKICAIVCAKCDATYRANVFVGVDGYAYISITNYEGTTQKGVSVSGTYWYFDI